MRSPPFGAVRSQPDSSLFAAPSSAYEHHAAAILRQSPAKRRKTQSPPSPGDCPTETRSSAPADGLRLKTSSSPQAARSSASRRQRRSSAQPEESMHPSLRPYTSRRLHRVQAKIESRYTHARELHHPAVSSAQARDR